MPSVIWKCLPSLLVSEGPEGEHFHIIFPDPRHPARAPTCRARSVSRDSGVATQGEVRPEGKGDLIISLRTFSGVQGCTVDDAAEGQWRLPGVESLRQSPEGDTGSLASTRALA